MALHTLASDYTGVTGSASDDVSQILKNFYASVTTGDAVITTGTHRIGTAGAVSGVVTLGSSTGVPIRMSPGARFTVDSGITLRIEGRFIADPRQQVFSGSGTVVLAAGTIDEISPVWWGADPTAATASTTAIQKAFDAAATLYDSVSVGGYDYRRGTTIRFPEGVYLTAGNTITRCLLVRGNGAGSTVIRSTTNAAVLTFAIGGLQLPYQSPELADIGIVGNRAGTSQHGVYLQWQTGATYDATMTVDRCQIINVGGNGFYSDTHGNTNRIRNSLIEYCGGAGIKLAGAFNTDCHIRGNVIRLNAIGIEFAADTTMATGFVINNLIESNVEGSGQLGSTTRPAAGIKLTGTWSLRVAYNYFEGHLNDVWCADRVSQCIFESNFHDGGSNSLPGQYTGFGGPARRLCAYYFSGQYNTANTLRGNEIYKPARPTGTSTSDWGGPTIPDTYEHLPVLTGVVYLTLDDNKWLDPATGSVGTVTYDSSAADYVVMTQTAIGNNGAALRQKTTTFSFETPLATRPVLNQWVYPAASTLGTLVKNTLVPRNTDDSFGTEVLVSSVDSAGNTVIEAGRKLGYRPTAGGSVATHEYASAKPASGTYQQGSIVWNTAPVIAGTAGSKYVVVGWVRLVTGSGHVLNTDWAEMRVPNGQ